jgi:hypothetical protein
MQTLEKILKLILLAAFSFLNALDMVQTAAFLKMGIEGNPIVLNDPQLWFALKFLLTFGIPTGLYVLDVYTETKGNAAFLRYLRAFIVLSYLTIVWADLFFLSLVLRNISVLSRFSP